MGDGFDLVVGANARRYRQAAGFTQAAVGESLGVPQQTVLKIERGERPLRFAEADKLAKLFGVEVTALSAPGSVAVAAETAAASEATMYLTSAAIALAEHLGRLACTVHAEGATSAADELLTYDWAAEVDKALLDAVIWNHTIPGAPSTVQEALQMLVQHGSWEDDDDPET